MPLGDVVPMEHAALLGCAALTGVGAVLNASAWAGDSPCAVGPETAGHVARIVDGRSFVALRECRQDRLPGGCGQLESGLLRSSIEHPPELVAIADGRLRKCGDELPDPVLESTALRLLPGAGSSLLP